MRARLRRMVTSEADLDDLVAESLKRTYEAADWRTMHQGLRFLTRVARNILIDQARRDQVVSFDYMADIEDLQRSFSPEPLLNARDELRRLESAIAQLPERQRRALLLRRVHGHSRAEIAAIMDISVSTVETHLTRALSGLARIKLEISEYVAAGSDGEGRAAGAHRREGGRVRRSPR
ncbi:MAG: RNA polymerase sigma factor [Pseudomonadota bacterium]|nr:RNA polymerase sigma factor [Pseudomonadota bacterium]